jgi:membrane-associated phospholipid phosphatase
MSRSSINFEHVEILEQVHPVHLPKSAAQKMLGNTWLLIAAISALALAGLSVAGISLAWRSVLGPLVAVLGLSGLAYFYRAWRPDERISCVLDCTAQLVAFTAACACLSYAVASAGGALWDETLFVWDQALGLNWRSYLSFIDSRPLLGTAFTFSYQSILFQMIFAVTALGFTGRLLACREFNLALVLAGVASVLISALVPAMAMFVHLGLTSHDFSNLNPAAAFVHVDHLEALRNGTFPELSLNAAEGIITFPSYHAALAVIFARAFWQIPWARLPGLLLNLSMIAATPIDGGHYFVDVIAGIIVAIVSIYIARRIHRGQLANKDVEWQQNP